MSGQGGRLDARVAVITGGASGLGEASARRFVEEGARVVIADVQPDRGEALAKELGDAARFQRTDVAREDEIAAAVDRAVSDWGQLDVVFANAGVVGAVGPIDETPVEDYDATMVLVLVMCGLAVLVVIADRCLWKTLPIVFGLLACGGACYLAWGALVRLGYL